MGSVRVRPDNGYLFFDFRFGGKRCREQTMLTDTKANRKKMESLLQKIEADIANNAFQYEQFFPNSKLASKFITANDSHNLNQPDSESQTTQLSTIASLSTTIQNCTTATH